MHRQTCCLTVLFALALIVGGSGTPANAQRSGNVAAANQSSTGTPPGGASRTLVIGTNVVHKERIDTSPNGSAQIVFPDQSTLNVGRNSSVVIDEYVYDPNAGAGTMAASLGKGVMRFVGGQISHTSGVTLQTPVGTLGVRGGSVTAIYPITASIAASNPAIAACRGALIAGHIGIATLMSKVGTAIVRPGYAACVDGSGGPITTFPIPGSTVTQLMALLTSSQGQHGGAIDLPTDQMASRSGLGGSIVNDPTHPPGSDPLSLITIIAGGNALAKDKANNTQAGQTEQPAPPPCVECGGDFTNFGGGLRNNGLR